MSSYFIIRHGSPKSTEVAVFFGSRRLTFSDGFVAGGVRCLVAKLDADDPDAEAVLERVKRMASYSVTQEDPRPVSARAGGGSRAAITKQLPVSEATEEALQLQSASRNGWSAFDIHSGIVLGQPASRSTITGLTLVEMALTSPPATWEEDRAVAWPWQLTKWHAPGPSWKAPRMGDKPGWAAVVGTAPVAPEVGDVGNTPARTRAEVADEADVGGDEGGDEGGAKVEGELRNEPDGASHGEGPAGAGNLGGDEALLAAYGTPDQRQSAIAALKVLLENAGGAFPSRQKANWMLAQKAGLPSANEATIAALCRAAQLSS